jgi:hypothetical protein
MNTVNIILYDQIIKFRKRGASNLFELNCVCIHLAPSCSQVLKVKLTDQLKTSSRIQNSNEKKAKRFSILRKSSTLIMKYLNLLQPPTTDRAKVSLKLIYSYDL